MTDRISNTFIPTSKISILVQDGTLHVTSATGYKLALGEVSHKMLNDLEVAISRTNQHQFPGNFTMQIVNEKVERPHFGKEDRTEKEADFSERGHTL